MPVPPITHPCWIRLARGDLGTLHTHHAATAMMVERLQHSREPVMLKASEIFSYFSKWGENLPYEVSQIRRLC